MVYVAWYVWFVVCLVWLLQVQAAYLVCCRCLSLVLLGAPRIYPPGVLPAVLQERVAEQEGIVFNDEIDIALRLTAFFRTALRLVLLPPRRCVLRSRRASCSSMRSIRSSTLAACCDTVSTGVFLQHAKSQQHAYCELVQTSVTIITSPTPPHNKTSLLLRRHYINNTSHLQHASKTLLPALPLLHHVSSYPSHFYPIISFPPQALTPVPRACSGTCCR